MSPSPPSSRGRRSLRLFGVVPRTFTLSSSSPPPRAVRRRVVARSGASPTLVPAFFSLLPLPTTGCVFRTRIHNERSRGGVAAAGDRERFLHAAKGLVVVVAAIVVVVSLAGTPARRYEVSAIHLTRRYAAPRRPRLCEAARRRAERGALRLGARAGRGSDSVTVAASRRSRTSCLASRRASLPDGSASLLLSFPPTRSNCSEFCRSRAGSREGGTRRVRSRLRERRGEVLGDVRPKDRDPHRDGQKRAVRTSGKRPRTANRIAGNWPPPPGLLFNPPYRRRRLSSENSEIPPDCR